MNQEWSSFWWNNITGANRLVSRVVDTLLNNEPAVLVVPSDLPWRYQMRSAVETSFRRNTSSEMIIDMVDAIDDCASYNNPGHFLLERYGQNREVRNGYREKSRKTIQTYLLEKDVLKNKIIWVKGLSNDQAKIWISFCQGYIPKHSGCGQFVLEMHGEAGFKSCNPIFFKDSISRYDVQLFNSIILDTTTKLHFGWKNYIATVVAALCDFDAEISEKTISIMDYKKDNPVNVIKKISEMEEYSRRGGEDQSRHVLAHARRDNNQYLNRRIWSAQVRVLFPLIEEERINLIEDMKGEIQDALIQNIIDQYGNQITDIYDVELGTLDYMMSHKDEKGLYMLHVPKEETREKIHFLRLCRNLLAHGDICTPDQVALLLDDVLTL